ncbi:MAG: LPS export ABC transporter periplasmic protein LptC [Treponema sp.]|nr:LPS export ABC transporter periplasmic protein LptC [Treponema sp.]MBQ4237599.1 LPS export ABC transporter periplasmic protein LptC [Treponema sp.]MBQ5384846.1 LPS export ABC transporter periplasmic protein LptC [Treponema sp.]
MIFRHPHAFIPLVLLLLILQSSCSLEYDQVVHSEDRIPELVFTNAQFTRYEKYKRSVRLQAAQLEQYKDTSNAYASDVSFFTWDSDKLDTEGSCRYLSLNVKEKIYSMFSEILITNYSNDLKIKAQNLKWNGNTEQLTSGVGETVYIDHEGLSMEGAGFSASGISRTYAFDYDVQGVYDDSPETAEEEEKEQ